MLRTSFAFVALLLPLGCSRPTPEPQIVAPAPDDSIPMPRVVPTRTPEAALAAGVAYLLAQQGDDGAWRSDVYSAFKDGTALTPFALCALQDALDAGETNPDIAKAIQKGCNFLMRFVKGAGIDPGREGFDYPVYTVALTIKAFSHTSTREFSTARSPWVKYLKERQLTEKLGWKPAEKQYGGWGYCQAIPRKPDPTAFAPALIESNLSATVFALEALRVVKELDGDTAKAAAVFVRRCQNDDGGFHFIYDDPVRNKAGVVNINDKPLVFHSYGSTTADGLRALAYCGLPADSKRQKDAVNWLAKNFRADTHPGVYSKGQEPNRQAVYFYYAASVSRALREAKLTQGRELAASLAARQKKDGHWENAVELVRENDPLVATCNAISALANCKLAA